MSKEPSKFTHILLDLDETIVRYVFDDRQDKENQTFLSDNYTLENGKYVRKDKKLPEVYTFNETAFLFRPYLKEFLSFISKNYIVAVWSAGTVEYVSSVIYAINKFGIKFYPSIVLSYVHCRLSEHIYGNQKHIKYIEDFFPSQGFKQSNTILIDDRKDNLNSYSKHYNITPFAPTTQASLDEDKELHRIKLDLEKKE